MSKQRLLNQPAVDLQLTTAEGTPTTLSRYWGDGRSLLLVFLRHLA